MELTITPVSITVCDDNGTDIALFPTSSTPPELLYSLKVAIEINDPGLVRELYEVAQARAVRR